VSHAKQRLKDAIWQLKEVRNNAREDRKRRLKALAELREDITKARRKLAKALEEEKAANVHQDRLRALRSKLERLQEQFGRQDTRKATLQLEVIRLRKRTEKLNVASKRATRGGVCDLCGRVLDKERAAKAEAEALLQLERTREVLKTVTDDVRDLRTRWDALATTIRELERESRPSLSVPDCKAQLRRARERFEAQKKQRSNWDDMTVKAMELKGIRKRDLQSLRTKLNKAERQIKYVLHMEQEYARDIPLDIQDASLPFLNKKASRYTNIITDGHIDIEFATEKMNKGGNAKEGMCVITKNIRGGSKYIKQSKGEKQKVDLVVASSLQALSDETARASVNAVFYDECYDSLDNQSISRVTQFLHEELKKRESVFVITHKMELASEFSNVLRVTRNTDGATILEED
jgi:DNA repair exonuclease SbcCD ATPase subunit